MLLVNYVRLGSLKENLLLTRCSLCHQTIVRISADAIFSVNLDLIECESFQVRDCVRVLSSSNAVTKWLWIVRVCLHVADDEPLFLPTIIPRCPAHGYRI